MSACFGHQSGLPLLEAVLKDRFTNAPAGSYTKRLFDDAAMLKSKLIEEAIELSEVSQPHLRMWLP